MGYAAWFHSFKQGWSLTTIPLTTRGTFVLHMEMLMNKIWLREKERRKALLQLADLMPGEPGARPILERLDELERLDREEPLSECPLDLAQLAELPREAHPVGCWIVRDQDIPEPWKSRFTVALGPATRVEDGFYLQDWTDFLDTWERDLAHVEQHREALDD